MVIVGRVGTDVMPEIWRKLGYQGRGKHGCVGRCDARSGGECLTKPQVRNQMVTMTIMAGMVMVVISFAFAYY